ncbi:hypothetical protein ACJX0J_025157, partial [Zea mays]
NWLKGKGIEKKEIVCAIESQRIILATYLVFSSNFQGYLDISDFGFGNTILLETLHFKLYLCIHDFHVSFPFQLYY